LLTYGATLDEIQSALARQNQSFSEATTSILAHGAKADELSSKVSSHESAFSEVGNQILELESRVLGAISAQKSGQNEVDLAVKALKTEVDSGLKQLSNELLAHVSLAISEQNEVQNLYSRRLESLTTQTSANQNGIDGVRADFNALKSESFGKIEQVTLRIQDHEKRFQEFALSSAQTTLLADTFTGNFDQKKTYKRGDTFTFRGGFYLVLNDARGVLPSDKNQQGANPTYACVAAPGAPGPAGSGGGGGGGIISITAGTGLTGGTITTNGTIAVDGTVVALRSALATVAFTGAYSDLTGKPALSAVATSGAYSDLSGKPSLATVATSGQYSDLTGAPTIPTGANPSASVGLTAVNGAASTFMRSDGAPAIDQTIAPTWSGVHAFAAANLTTTTFTEVLLKNSTAATSSVKLQNSPAIEIQGNVWTSSGGAASRTSGFKIYNVVSGISTANGLLTIDFYRAGTLLNNVLTLSQAGILSVPGLQVSGTPAFGQLLLTNGNGLYITNLSSGQTLQLYNADNSGGPDSIGFNTNGNNVVVNFGAGTAIALDDWFDQSVKTTASPTFASVGANSGGNHRCWDSTNADYSYILNPGSNSATQGMKFVSNGSNGFLFNTYSGGVVNALSIVADGSATFGGNLTITSGKDLQLGRAYAAGVVVATGTIQIKDSTGSIYNVLVHT